MLTSLKITSGQGADVWGHVVGGLHDQGLLQVGAQVGSQVSVQIKGYLRIFVDDQVWEQIHLSLRQGAS